MEQKNLLEIIKDYRVEVLMLIIILSIISYFALNMLGITIPLNTENNNIEIIYVIFNTLLVFILIGMSIFLAKLVIFKVVEIRKAKFLADYFFTRMPLYQKCIIIDLIMNNGRKSYNNQFARYIESLLTKNIVVIDETIYNFQHDNNNSLIHVTLNKSFIKVISSIEFRENFRFKYNNPETIEKVNDIMLKIQTGLHKK